MLFLSDRHLLVCQSAETDEGSARNFFIAWPKRPLGPASWYAAYLQSLRRPRGAPSVLRAEGEVSLDHQHSMCIWHLQKRSLPGNTNRAVFDALEDATREVGVVRNVEFHFDRDNGVTFPETDIGAVSRRKQLLHFTDPSASAFIDHDGWMIKDVLLQ